MVERAGTEQDIQRMVEEAFSSIESTTDGVELGRRFRLALIETVTEQPLVLSAGQGRNAAEQKRSLAALLRSKTPSFVLPVVVREEVPPVRAALLTAVGSLLGLLLLAPLTRWSLGSGDHGIILGALLGAGAMSYLVSTPRLLALARQLLIAALSAAAVTRLLASPFRIFGSLWSLLRLQQRTVSERILLVGCAVLVIVLGRSEPVMDKLETREMAHQIGRLWLTYTLYLLSSSQDETAAGDDEMLLPLVEQCYRLHKTTAERLPLAAQELLQMARSMGFDGLDGVPTFLDQPVQKKLTWSDSLSQEYQAFGYIASGDPVEVMDTPIIRGDSVIKRGTVRKVRAR